MENMEKIFLSQNWTLANSADLTTVTAQVPGNVLGDLYRAEIIPDPFFGCNSNDLRKYEFADWEYRTTFTAPALQDGEKLQLVFDGIDTVAEIFLNGEKIGDADNMFIPHRFPLSNELLKSENELVVKIASSVNHARKFRRPVYSRSLIYNFEGLYLRRPMHTYGWDIAPRLVGAGLWRPVYLEILKPERWTDLYLATVETGKKKSSLVLSWAFESDKRKLTGYEANLKMVCKDHVFEKRFPLYFTTGVLDFEIPDAKLWNPAGSGEPDLYDVTLELLHEGTLADRRSWRTGVRTIELKRTAELNGNGNGEFVFIVNGRKTFIKGSNWVPSDALHGENPERVRKNLELFRDLGCNMVRCWGGNVYEDQDFFDYCDENGLLVWQDFMFACETAPLDDDFLAKVRHEAEEVICALRNHPSLAVWCGDNECDQLFFGKIHEKLLPSFNRISREILPQAVAMFDPVRDYLPSSPYFSDELKLNNARYRSTEQHLWGPRDTWKGRFYKENIAIFASEIGYHGMTNVESIQKFIPAAELNNRHGASWTCHAAQPFGDLHGAYSYRNKLMENQSREFWGYLAQDLTEFMKCSQIVQAEAMKFFIELFRAKKWSKTGLIWWNVIDCWPQFSDAVVDYYYVRKLAYYYIKNAQKPVSLIVSDPEGWHCPLTAVNDTRENLSGSFRVSDLMTGELFAGGEFEAAANSAENVTFFPVCQCEQRMLLIEWCINGETSYNHYLLGAAPFDFTQYSQWLTELDKIIYKKTGRYEW